MNYNLPIRFYAFLTRHPGVMFALMLVLAFVAWIVVFLETNRAIVVYEGF
jgi:hypothetical protein